VAIADLDLALGSMERILLDSSTLIAFHTAQEEAHPLAVHLLGRIERADDPLRGYCSVINATELLVRPIRTGQREFTFMHTFLTGYPNLTLLPVDMFVATQTAALRASTNIRLPDAMIIGSGLLAGCEAVVSNDEGWKRRCEPLFSDFRWLYLADYL